MHSKPNKKKQSPVKMQESSILDKYKNDENDEKEEIIIKKEDFEYNKHDEAYGVGALKLLQSQSKYKIKNLKNKKKKKPIIISKKIDGDKLYKSDNRKFFYYRKPSVELKDFLIDNENKTFLDYGVYCLKKKMNRFFLQFVRNFVMKEKEKIRLQEIKELERIEEQRKKKLEKKRLEEKEKKRKEKNRLEEEKKKRLEEEEKLRLEKEEKLRLEEIKKKKFKEEKKRLKDEKKIRLEKKRIKDEENEKIRENEEEEEERKKIFEKEKIEKEKLKIKFKKLKTNLSKDFKTIENENTIDFESSNSQKQNLKSNNYNKLLDLSLKEEDENKLENNEIEANILIISTNEELKDNYFDLKESNNGLENLKAKVSNMDYEMRMKKISNTDSLNRLRDSIRDSALKIDNKKEIKNFNLTEKDKKLENQEIEILKSENVSQIQDTVSNEYFNTLEKTTEDDNLKSKRDSIDSNYFDFGKKDDLEKKEYVKKMRVGTFSRGNNAFQIYQKQQEEKKMQLQRRRSSLDERRVNRRSFMENVGKEFFVNKKKSEMLKKEEEKEEDDSDSSNSSDSSFDSSDEGMSMEECPEDMKNSLERENFSEDFNKEKDENIFVDKKIYNNLYLYDEKKNLKDDEVFNLFNKNLKEDKGDDSPIFFEKKNIEENKNIKEDNIFGQKKEDIKNNMEESESEVDIDGAFEDEDEIRSKRKSRSDKVNEFENLIRNAKEKRKSERQQKKRDSKLIKEEGQNEKIESLNKNNLIENLTKKKSEKKKKIEENILEENEENFNKSLDQNIEIFENQKRINQNESFSDKSLEDKNLKENIINSNKTIDYLKNSSLRENGSFMENNNSSIRENESISNKSDNEENSEKDLKKEYKKKKTEEEIRMKKKTLDVEDSENDESSDISSFDEKSKDNEKEQKDSVNFQDDFENNNLEKNNMKKIRAVLKKLTDNLDSDKILSTITEERFSNFPKSEKKSKFNNNKVFLERLEEENSISNDADNFEMDFNIKMKDKKEGGNNIDDNNLNYLKEKEVSNINKGEKISVLDELEKITKKNIKILIKSIKNDSLKKYEWKEKIKKKKELRLKKINEKLVLEKLTKKNILKLFKNAKKDFEKKIEFNKNLEYSKSKKNFKLNKIRKTVKNVNLIYKEDEKNKIQQIIPQYKVRKNSLDQIKKTSKIKILLNVENKFIEQDKTEIEESDYSKKNSEVEENENQRKNSQIEKNQNQIENLEKYKEEKLNKIRKTLKNVNLIYKEDEKIEKKENIPEFKLRKNSLDSENLKKEKEEKIFNLKMEKNNVDLKNKFIEQDKTEVEESVCSESELKIKKNKKVRESIMKYNNIVSERELSKNIIITIRQNSIDRVGGTNLSLEYSPSPEKNKKNLKTIPKNFKKDLEKNNEVNFRKNRQSKMLSKKKYILTEIVNNLEKEDDYKNNLEDMENLSNSKRSSKLINFVLKNEISSDNMKMIERKNSLENLQDDFKEEIENFNKTNLRTSSFSKNNIDNKNKIKNLNSSQSKFFIKEKKQNLVEIKGKIEKEGDYHEKQNNLEDSEDLKDIKRNSKLKMIKNNKFTNNPNMIERKNSLPLLDDLMSESYDINEEYISQDGNSLKTSNTSIKNFSSKKNQDSNKKRKSKLFLKDKNLSKIEIKEDIEKEEDYEDCFIHRNYSFNGYQKGKTEKSKLFFSTLNRNNPLELEIIKKKEEEKIKKDWQKYKESFSYKMMSKMNKVLEKRPYMTQESCFTYLQNLMSQMVSKDFIIFLLDLDEDEIDSILKIQRFWRKRTNKMIIRKILNGQVYFKRETNLARSRFNSVLNMNSEDKLQNKKNNNILFTSNIH